MENFIVLSILVVLNHEITHIYAIRGQTERHLSSSAYNKVVNTVQPLMTNCQCIVLTSLVEPYFMPELAERLIKHAAHLQSPLQIHSLSTSFRFQSYNGSQHRGLELVFLYVAPVGPLNGILYWEHPLKFEGDQTYTYLYPFLLVYVVDESYLKSAIWSNSKYRACNFLPNIIYLMFWSLQPDLPVQKFALQYRCDGDSFCMPMLESATMDGQVGYKPVMEELRIKRRNFHGHTIAVNGPELLMRRMWIELKSIFGDPFRNANLGLYTPFVPLFHLATHSNFSMNFYVPKSLDFNEECDVGWVELDTLIASVNSEGQIPAFLEREHQDILLQAGQVEQNFPLTFQSILGPMKWDVWLLLGLVTTLVWAQEAFKTQCKERYIWPVAFVAYYCGQYFRPGKATRLWCTFWVVILFFISTFYTGELQSLQIVPRVSTQNTSFEDLMGRNSRFFASFHTYFRYRRYQNSSPYTAFRSEKTLKQLKQMASVIQIAPFHLPTAADVRQAMKNTSSIWLTEEAEVQAYCKMFTQQLGVSCQLLKFGFLAYNSWTAMFVPHGDTVVEKYRVSMDAGIVQYWERKRSQQLAVNWEEHYLKSLDFSDDRERAFRSSTGAVGFGDSVLKETFCLYALGIGISLVSISVLTFFSMLEFYWETVSYGIPEAWIRP